MSLAKYKNLFLRQSYFDALEDYNKALTSKKAVLWDYVIITASNDSQAKAYREQIDHRLANNSIPLTTHYAVLPDPGGKRVGSGGATLNVMRYIREISSDPDCFKNKRILVIHSGGDSKRVPQYSACGKLFSPVPRELPDHRRSTLFDEFIISMSGIPARIKDGMLVLSGDVLLLFNPLQIDFHQTGAAAFTIKEDVETGKNHGVFLGDDHRNVSNFLHKMSVETLREAGAIDEHNNVDIDTGAVIFESTLLNDFIGLISTSGEIDELKFDQFVNDKVQLSLYGDFLYPLASNSTLEQYYKEKPEGQFSEELKVCRTAVWNVISKFDMKLICLSPAAFIHFGTTKELLHLMSKELDNYVFLDWSKKINTNLSEGNYAVSNSLISGSSMISDNCYIEDCLIGDNVSIGDNCVLSNIAIENIAIPSDIVLHGLKLNDGRYVVRIYDVDCNPKATLEENAKFLGQPLSDFIAKKKLQINDVWDGDDHSLWCAKVYTACDTMEEAVQSALSLCTQRASCGQICQEVTRPVELSLCSQLDSCDNGNIVIEQLCSEPDNINTRIDRMSLCSSFNAADVTSILPWQIALNDEIKSESFINAINERQFVDDLLLLIPQITNSQLNILLTRAQQSEFSEKMRIYYYLSKAIKDDREALENLCFKTIHETMLQSVLDSICIDGNNKIKKDEVVVKLPLRVNWGGGWSDTPPYCIENGGTVLNAAVKVRGEFPVEVLIKRLEERKIVLECADSGECSEFKDIEELLNCRDTFDPFALHKAALIVCGIIHYSDKMPLDDILSQLGGGFRLSTCVRDIPRGSGLGTSSILAGACVKGIFEFLGKTITENELYDKVLCLEQLMSTGGGWQDQVGGLAPGIKIITSQPGILQNIAYEPVDVRIDVINELQSRFCLIYTGQRRLARNLLREVIGRYIASNPISVSILHEIQRVAVLMRFELEKGNVDEFAKLLNEHWELSKKLDMGCTNTCIEQIFMICDDLIDGKMICGAGGGGFLQVILKKQYSVNDLRVRLKTVFGDTGVDAWECEFV